MIRIKKIEVTPLEYNEGKIINSFNTTDSKTSNAPSINAVETYISEIVEPIEEEITTIEETLATIEETLATLNPIGDNFYSLEIELTVQAGNSNATHIFTLPTNWTKDNTYIVSTMYKITPSEGLTGYTTTFDNISNLLGDLNIYIGNYDRLYTEIDDALVVTVYRPTGTTDERTYTFKILLMTTAELPIPIPSL